MKLHFLGGSSTVTGSKFLLEHDDCRILIDCGLFQGVKSLRLKNWEKFPVPPDSIHAVFLTHAHLDHSGYLPRLVSHGFQGNIYSTEATLDLCRIILPDSGYLQEEEAKYRNKTKSTKHKPALPLYSELEARQCLKSFKTLPINKPIEIGPFKISLYEAGHILGAASVRVECAGRSVVFSGDIGRYNDLLMTPPINCPQANAVVMETTYGDRSHSTENPIAQIREILQKVVRRKGVLMIPSFAVGRAQTLLYIFQQIFTQHPDLKVPLYLNSPMAVDVTHLFKKHLQEHKLDKSECHEVCSAAEFVNTPEDSKALNERQGPMVIISASGMLSGGRILHHIKAFGKDPANGILLAGFQAPGTRGYAIANGAEELKIHGGYHKINAELFQMDSLSAHADQKDLLRWLNPSPADHRKIYLVHGEYSASQALQTMMEENHSTHSKIPEMGDKIDI